jgi:HD-GYP domain-containing protein (c-di-GMP phosphodiesterase class II)
MSFETPGQHCLDRIIKLAEKQAVVTTQDIYDDRGFKLWAKGVQVSQELQAKLLKRKLAAPLESSLSVEHAVSFADIHDDCLARLGEQPLLQKIAGARAVRDVLAEAKRLHIPQPLRLLLTSAKFSDSESYAHTLNVITICAGIAGRLNASTNDIHSLLMAAALHDIGELYINPEYLHSKRRLASHEWKHIVTHPRIGQLLIKDLTTLPPAVATCVGQHHERYDGSGYPHQHGVADLHRLSGWIAVADAASALLNVGQGAAERVALALRIVPGEFDRDAAGVLIQALHDPENGYGEAGSSEGLARARETLGRIASVRRLLNEIVTAHPILRQIGGAAENLLKNISQAMHATGVPNAELLGDSINDPQLLAEMHLVMQEVGWRLRNLARNIYLHAESQPTDEALTALNGVVEMLDA